MLLGYFSKSTDLTNQLVIDVTRIPIEISKYGPPARRENFIVDHKLQRVMLADQNCKYLRGKE